MKNPISTAVPAPHPAALRASTLSLGRGSAFGCRLSAFGLLPPLAAFALAFGSAARAQEASPSNKTPVVVDEAEVVRLALSSNPSLQAAAGEARRAELLELAERHRYHFALQLDGSANRGATPSLAGRETTTSTSTGFVAGAELRRPLVWGTVLRLRFEGTRQQNRLAFDPTTPVAGLVDLGPGYGASLRLAFTQPLLRGFGRRVGEADLRAAKAGTASAQSGRDRAASQLLADVLSAYWELHHASRALDIQQRSLESARAQRDETAARVRTGSVAPVEVLSFDTRVASIEEDVASAEAEERRRSAELARLLGDASLTPRRADLGRSPPLPPAPDEGAKALVLETSFEVAEQKAAVGLAEVQASTAAESLRPRLDLEGFVQPRGLGNQSIAPAFDQLASLGAMNAYIGVAYEVPLDDTQRRSEKERAQVAVDNARLRLDAVSQRVLAELDTALIRDESARRRLELAGRTHAIALRQLEAETARFRTGSATAFQVREAEDQVRSAELREARAQVDLVEASLAIGNLTGELLGRYAAGAAD